MGVERSILKRSKALLAVSRMVLGVARDGTRARLAEEVKRV